MAIKRPAKKAKPDLSERRRHKKQFQGRTKKGIKRATVKKK